MKKHLILTSLAAIVATTGAASAVTIEEVVANAKMDAAVMPETSAEPQYSSYSYDSNGDGTADAYLTNGSGTDVIDTNSEAFTYQNRKGNWADLTLDTATGTAQADQAIDAADYYYYSTVADTTYHGDDEHINKSLYKYNVTDNNGDVSETNLADTTAISQGSYTYGVSAEFTQRTTPQTIEHEPVFSDYVGLDATLAGKTLADYMLADGSGIDSTKIAGLDSAAQTSIQNAFAAYTTDHNAYETAKGYYDASVAEFNTISAKANADETVVAGMNSVFVADSADYSAKKKALDDAQQSLLDAQGDYTTDTNNYNTAVANATDYNASLSKVIKDADQVTLDSAKQYTNNAVAGKADAEAVDNALSLKADAATVNTELSLKANTADVNDALDGKADKATTLAGYGITDAYTTGEVDNLVNGAKDFAKGYTDGIANGLRNEFAAADALTLRSANAYTDSKVKSLEKNMSGGVAAATALSAVSVGNVNRGEVSVGGGYGYFNGQSAMAFGAAMGLSDSWSINAGAGIASGDSTQFSIRAGTNYKFKMF